MTSELLLRLKPPSKWKASKRKEEDDEAVKVWTVAAPAIAPCHRRGRNFNRRGRRLKIHCRRRLQAPIPPLPFLLLTLSLPEAGYVLSFTCFNFKLVHFPNEILFTISSRS
ncbi:hypothetical protein PIB30_101549 [Stylosanthes scabra]|uniref:Uncharacterized protein n=1 Tax=Stylosanthes scabra TaxID=79078 RepID=A0ABU6WVP5_9FABA|nr:hypothetical protein [Stylosanthes scabra]